MICESHVIAKEKQQHNYDYESIHLTSNVTKYRKHL